MKKIHNATNIIKIDNTIAIFKRLKNDNDGNPRFEVQVISLLDLHDNTKDIHNDVYNDNTYVVTSYDIHKDIEILIKGGE